MIGNTPIDYDFFFNKLAYALQKKQSTDSNTDSNRKTVSVHNEAAYNEVGEGTVE